MLGHLKYLLVLTVSPHYTTHQTLHTRDQTLDTRQPRLTTVRVSDQVCEAEKEDDSGHALNLKGETAENNGLLTRPVLPVPCPQQQPLERLFMLTEDLHIIHLISPHICCKWDLLSAEYYNFQQTVIP